MPQLVQPDSRYVNYDRIYLTPVTRPAWQAFFEWGYSGEGWGGGIIESFIPGSVRQYAIIGTFWDDTAVDKTFRLVLSSPGSGIVFDISGAETLSSGRLVGFGGDATIPEDILTRPLSIEISIELQELIDSNWVTVEYDPSQGSGV